MTVAALPQWISPTLHRTAGRDPLALQTITQDRIIPVLLPGILALSRRARYFSFHCFLLGEYARRQMPATNAALGRFILAREYELALAVELCPRGCGSSPVGRDRSGPATASLHDSYERGESVESPLGGYGLYYRSPLTDLGLVARTGTLLGGEPTPVDVLVPDGKGAPLAEAFRGSVEGTVYFKKHFSGLRKIPRQALVEYAEAACLCRLDQHTDERTLLREAFFEPASGDFEEAARQRQRSFGLFLQTTKDDRNAAIEPAAFRARVWADFLVRNKFGDTRAGVTSQWAALILKEHMQEALSAMWIDVCQAGLRQQPDDGLAPDELRSLLREGLIAGRAVKSGRTRIACKPTMATRELAQRFAQSAAKLSLEDLRTWARGEGTAIAGVLFLMTVCDRLPVAESLSDVDRAFLDVGVQRSMRQEGLLQVARALDAHLSEEPTLADTIEWAVRRLVIDVHERVAYSKLPNFTFRFRWENGRLRFYDLGIWPFDLADMRHGSMSQLSLDLGYWRRTPKGDARLTPDGTQFLTGAFQ